MILAIDTTREFGSVALLSSDESIETPLYAESGFGQILFGALADILERSGRRLQDVDCFAAASGPGSFTGVRVGLACVKGLAEANGKRSSSSVESGGDRRIRKGNRRATVLDARRGEIYGAVYDAELKLIAPEVVAPFPQWLATLPSGELEFVAQDFALFRDAPAEKVRRSKARRSSKLPELSRA